MENLVFLSEPTYSALSYILLRGNFKAPDSPHLFYQERLLIREAGLLYLIVRRTLEAGHPLIQLPDQVCGISGEHLCICSGRYMVTGDPNKFLQQQLCNLLTWKYFWCLKIIMRQLQASLLLGIETGMGYSYVHDLLFHRWILCEPDPHWDSS